MLELLKITQEELKDKRLTGLDDTPGLSTIAMQARFDAHPDKNTEVINENARRQESNNALLSERLQKAEASLLNKQNREEGKVLSSNDFTDSEKDKLLNIEFSANNYVLPVSDENTLGGVKRGQGLEISPEGVISAADHERRIKDAENAILGKVNKEEGKALSSNDFTNEEKEKLRGIELGANNYSLPLATENALGGITAPPASLFDDIRVKIDAATGRLYVNSREIIRTIPDGDTMKYGDV